ncbi:hypothetical protein HRJ35_16515 [Shewanella oneidensis MR-1]|nr:hypothetical protein [Shewanella oneidensis]MDX5999555.1 hypothetical protein [Shewanella oneidensis]QKG94551.1 hypothetical protein HRJ35_16515 [Shewanella oneidensis MR-1]
MDLVRVNKQGPTGKAARTPESRAPVISGKIAADDVFRPPDDVTGTVYTAGSNTMKAQQPDFIDLVLMLLAKLIPFDLF